MSLQSSKSISLARARSVSWRVMWAAFGAATLSLAVTNAHASEVVVESKRVTYADLDLSKRADAVILYSRLRGASNVVCGDYDPRDLQARRFQEACYRKALADAVAKVNHPEIIAVHGSENTRIAQSSPKSRSRS